MSASNPLQCKHEQNESSRIQLFPFFSFFFFIHLYLDHSSSSSNLGGKVNGKREAAKGNLVFEMFSLNSGKGPAKPQRDGKNTAGESPNPTKGCVLIFDLQKGYTPAFWGNQRSDTNQLLRENKVYQPSREHFRKEDRIKDDQHPLLLERRRGVPTLLSKLQIAGGAITG